MLKLKLQYLGHLIQTANSVEKALMLGKIESRKRRGQQRMRQLDIITDWMDMNLNKHQEILVDREAQHAAVHGVSKSQTRLSDWTRRRRRVAHSISTVLESDSWGLCQNYKPKAMPQRWILVSVDGRHTLVSYSEHGNLHLARYVCRSMYHFFVCFYSGFQFTKFEKPFICHTPGFNKERKIRVMGTISSSTSFHVPRGSYFTHLLKFLL